MGRDGNGRGPRGGDYGIIALKKEKNSYGWPNDIDIYPEEVWEDCAKDNTT